MSRLPLALALSLALGGCTALGPDYARPALDVPAAQAPVGPIDAQWWTAFADPALDGLIDEAFAANQDLVQAAARVAEARAAFGIVDADRMPQLGVRADATRTRLSESGLTPVLEERTVDLGSAQLMASYELDLWGKLARASEAARAELLASEAARDTVRLSLVAMVARSYFELRALDAQLEVARRTLASRNETAALQRKRYEGGSASELEVRQAQAEALDAAARVPQLEQQLALTEHVLGVLLGRSPRALVEERIARGTAIEALRAPPALPAGLPADLLERRPDLREAEQRLVAANARIGQAKAAWFPSITLTGNLGSESRALADLFGGSAGTWSLAAGLVQPLFDGGRIDAGIAAAEARTAQAEAGYRKAVQIAFRETLDALVASRTTGEQYQARAERVTALEQALSLAWKRYEAGYSAYLDVLDAQRNLFQAELDRITAQRERLGAAVSVYQALGGGWTAPS